MSSHRHQSSLEGILDFSEPFSLTPQQSDSAKRLLGVFIHQGLWARASDGKGLQACEINLRYARPYHCKRLIFDIFFLTYIHESLANLTTNITLALSLFEDIASREPAARSDVMSALEGFAHYMVTQFFLPRMCHVFCFLLLSNSSNLVRASSIKTSQPTPCPQSNRQPLLAQNGAYLF